MQTKSRCGHPISEPQGFLGHSYSFRSWACPGWYPVEAGWQWGKLKGISCLRQTTFFHGVYSVPDLRWFDLQFAGVRASHICGNCTWHFEIWSFPRLVICGRILSWCWAVAAAVQGQARDHKGKQPILISVCIVLMILHNCGLCKCSEHVWHRLS